MPDAVGGTSLLGKLVTPEDHRHLHKIFGCLAVCHMLPRLCLSLTRGEDALASCVGPAARCGLLVPQLLLSLSAFTFRVPHVPNTSRPMIHQTFRAHSVIFATRSVACAILAAFGPRLADNKGFLVARYILVLATAVAADRITAQDDSTFQTTRSMPYWEGVTGFRMDVHRHYYAWAQFGATYLCLVGAELPVVTTLVAIQGAAFLMTLSRKSIISVYVYHMVYTFLLTLTQLVMLTLTTESRGTGLEIGALINTAYVLRVWCGVNKFLVVSLLFVWAICLREDVIGYLDA